MGSRRLGQIGALLRERRGALGVRQAAREIGVSAATLSRIENGKQPDLDTFAKLCRWLEVSPSAFLDVEGTGAVGPSPESRTVATAHLRANRQISPELSQALGEMIMRAQSMLADDPSAQDPE